MTLNHHLQSTFPIAPITHKPKGSYDIYEASWFRLIITPHCDELQISFIRTSCRRQRHGRQIVAALMQYCHLTNLRLVANGVEKPQQTFWRRCGFIPTKVWGRWKYDD